MTVAPVGCSRLDADETDVSQLYRPVSQCSDRPRRTGCALWPGPCRRRARWPGVRPPETHCATRPME